MAFLREYLRSRAKIVLLFLFFAALFLTVFLLYGADTEPMAYAFGLCFFFGLLCMAVDIRRVYVRRRRLRSAVAAVPDEEALPETADLVEREYKELVKAFYAHERALREEQERRYDAFSSYFTVWAHQIKTPISALDLMFQSGQGDSSCREELKQIQRYVDMALCYLRLDGDTTDYVIRSYDVDAIVRKAVRSFASQFIRKKLRLEYTAVEIRAVTDEKALGFVVEQLLSNALKYTPSGSVFIEGIDHHLLRIRDTGIGIAAEDLPRIFERGFTGENGRVDAHASGLGLYLCGRILKNLGHSVTVESEPGKGTSVTIDLAPGLNLTKM